MSLRLHKDFTSYPLRTPPITWNSFGPCSNQGLRDFRDGNILGKYSRTFIYQNYSGTFSSQERFHRTAIFRNSVIPKADWSARTKPKLRHIQLIKLLSATRSPRTRTRIFCPPAGLSPSTDLLLIKLAGIPSERVGSRLKFNSSEFYGLSHFTAIDWTECR